MTRHARAPQTMTPHQRLEQLDAARELAREIVNTRIDTRPGSRAGRGPGGRVGISPSTVGEIHAFLHRRRDLARFDRFLELYPVLDREWPQNARNPSGERRALAHVLREERRRHSQRTVEEWLVILGWARWLISGESEGLGSRGQSRDVQGRAAQRACPEDRKPRDKAPSQFNALGSAFKKAGFE